MPVEHLACCRKGKRYISTQRSRKKMSFESMAMTVGTSAEKHSHIAGIEILDRCILTNPSMVALRVVKSTAGGQAVRAGKDMCGETTATD